MWAVTFLRKGLSIVRTLLALAVLMFASVVTQVSAQSEKRVRATLHSLIDSVETLLDTFPKTVRRGAVSTIRDGRIYYDKNRQLIINLGNESPFTLLHEYGHFWSLTDPIMWYQYADSLYPTWTKSALHQRIAEEAFANDFANAFPLLAPNTPPVHPGVRWVWERLIPLAKKNWK